MKRLIITLDHPMAEWEYRKYGIPIFIERGLICESWICGAFTVSKQKKIEETATDIQKKIAIQIFDIASKKEFEQKVSTLNSLSDVILAFTYDPYIFRTLVKYNIPYGWFNLGSLPVPDPAKYTFIQYLNVLFSPQRVINFIKRTYTNYLYSKIETGLNFLVCSGTISQSHFLKRTNTHLIKAHNLDYNLFLENKPKNLIGKKYAVFLDVYAPFHIDNILLNIPLPCIAENYYPNLNKFFAYIEKKFDTEVVIAAHPRSEYEEKYPDLFQGHRMFKHQTLDLVAHSDLVITQDSTAINFAVLYKKNIIFVKDTENYSHQFLLSIDIFAKEMQKNAIDLSKPYFNNLQNSDFLVDNNVYSTYENKYIKEEGSPEKHHADILADYLLNT